MYLIDSYKTTNISIFSIICTLFFVAQIFAVTGSLDSTFGTNGIATVLINGLDQARDVIVQPDGKIIIAGTSQTSGNQDFSLCRLNADGSSDSSFGVNGRVLTPFSSFDSLDNAWAAALQTDGKIILAGTYSNGSGTLVALARYNSDGSLDTSFDVDGKVTTAVGFLSNISDVAVQSDGKIVTIGTFVSSPGGGSFFAARFNTNGTLDTSFGSNGIAVTVFGTGGAQAYTVAIQPDGKLVLGGYSFTRGNTTGFTLIRYNLNGTLDTTFGTEGKVVTLISNDAVILNSTTQDIINSLVIQPNGKIVAAGSSAGNFYSYDSALARYNSDGSLDTTFGVGGKVITPISVRDDILTDVALQSDGKLVVSGFGWASVTNNDFIAGRYNSDGTPDSSFGIGGFAFTSISNNNDGTSAVALQADGKIITVGTSTGGFIITRYPVNGLRTTDFEADSKSDISVFRPSNGVWYLLNSNIGFSAAQFGISTDKVVPADYDGDDKTDIAVWRSGTWYLQRSTQGFTGIQFGSVGDIPQPFDFDGDGRAELAVFRPSNGYWYVLNLVSKQVNTVQFGVAEDKPVVADYDGDGKADYAVYRPSSGVWYLLQSTRGFSAIQFGIATDKPVVGDYDGDGKADQAVYRLESGTWYLLKSKQGFASIQFGLPTDIPAPADFDGDGKTDIAVFPPESGTWYQMKSTQGFGAVQFGANGDKPIPSAFVP